jgi:hypothetical protein
VFVTEWDTAPCLCNISLKFTTVTSCAGHSLFITSWQQHCQLMKLRLLQTVLTDKLCSKLDGMQLRTGFVDTKLYGFNVLTNYISLIAYTMQLDMSLFSSWFLKPKPWGYIAAIKPDQCKVTLGFMMLSDNLCQCHSWITVRPVILDVLLDWLPWHHLSFCRTNNFLIHVGQIMHADYMWLLTKT